MKTRSAQKEREPPADCRFRIARIRALSERGCQADFDAGTSQLLGLQFLGDGYPLESGSSTIWVRSSADRCSARAFAPAGTGDRKTTRGADVGGAPTPAADGSRRGVPFPRRSACGHSPANSPSRTLRSGKRRADAEVFPVPFSIGGTKRETQRRSAERRGGAPRERGTRSHPEMKGRRLRATLALPFGRLDGTPPRTPRFPRAPSTAAGPASRRSSPCRRPMGSLRLERQYRDRHAGTECRRCR
jgi:hypothetical protein